MITEPNPLIDTHESEDWRPVLANEIMECEMYRYAMFVAKDCGVNQWISMASGLLGFTPIELQTILKVPLDKKWPFCAKGLTPKFRGDKPRRQMRPIESLPLP